MILFYTLVDEVHQPEGHVLRCALGYTLMDEVHQPEGHVLRCALGYTLKLLSNLYISFLEFRMPSQLFYHFEAAS